MQLWAQGSLPDDANPDTDIETTLDTWGTGSNVTTKLCNPAQEVCSAPCNTFEFTRYRATAKPVSYTHLTLPTIYSV